MKGLHGQVWHEFALKHWGPGKTYSYVTKKVEKEFGLTDMNNAVRSFLYRQTPGYQNRKKIESHGQYLSVEKKKVDIKLGTKVRFDPLYGCVAGGHEHVTGKVIDIRNRWFGVEYDLGGTKQRTSFNFCDIDQNVHICKGAHA